MGGIDGVWLANGASLEGVRVELFVFGFLANTMCCHDRGLGDFEHGMWASVVIFVFAAVAAVVCIAIICCYHAISSIESDNYVQSSHAQ